MSTLADALREAGVIERFGVAPTPGRARPPVVRAAVSVRVQAASTEVIGALWSWGRAAVPGLPTEWTDGDLGSGPEALTALHVEEGEQAAWRLTVGLPGDASAVIDIAAGGGGLDIGARVEGDADALAALFRPLVRVLADHGATVGHDRLPTASTALIGREEVAALVDTLLDPARSLPVVLVTAFTRRSGEYAIDPDAAAEACLGLARVVVVPGWSDTFALSDRLMKLGCYAGGVRVYWPGLSLNDLLEDHPLYLPRSIGAHTLGAMARRLGAWSAARYEPPRLARQLLTGRARREAVQSAIHSALQAAVVTAPHTEAVGAAPFPPAHVEVVSPPAAGAEAPAVTEMTQPVGASAALMQEVENLAGRVADLSGALSDAEQGLAARDDRIRELEAQVQALQYRLAAREDPYSGAEVTLDEPESIEEAVILAEDYFVHELVITQGAHRSAPQMNPADNRPAKLWKALCDLARVARRWQKDDLPQGIQGALRDAGWDPHPVSVTAIGQHTSDYCFFHEGSLVTLRYSLQLSRGERVYWAQDEATRRFIVGHIGQHLPDSTTG